MAKSLELEEAFRDEMRQHTSEYVISLNCPKCGSNEVGYHVANEQYDCHDCGFKWKNISEEV